jgi:hypothetical protein
MLARRAESTFRQRHSVGGEIFRPIADKDYSFSVEMSTARTFPERIYIAVERILSCGHDWIIFSKGASLSERCNLGEFSFAEMRKSNRIYERIEAKSKESLRLVCF